MPDPDAARKPPKRFWLLAPYGAVLVAFVLWSAAWLAIRSEVASRLDAVQAAAQAKGLTLDWDR
ncbi:MAG: hypothetical protein JO127_13895, partial [Caulobacteraceae bacterium]|nr:hypothetical protein [Caulobacteraceae bacterium]